MLNIEDPKKIDFLKLKSPLDMEKFLLDEIRMRLLMLKQKNSIEHDVFLNWKLLWLGYLTLGTVKLDRYMFEKVNLEWAIINERNVQKENSENQVLSQFKGLFEAEWENDRRVLRTINYGATSSNLPLSTPLLEEKIFELESIRTLCVKYRLRFLSTKG